MAHIFCRHLVDFEETALERGGLTKEQYGVLEVEANWFVSEFLAPRAVLKIFNFEKPNEIALLCDISKMASEKRFSQLKKFSYASEDSNHILRNFYAHLASGEYLKVIFHKPHLPIISPVRLFRWQQELGRRSRPLPPSIVC